MTGNDCEELPHLDMDESCLFNFFYNMFSITLLYF